MKASILNALNSIIDPNADSNTHNSDYGVRLKKFRKQSLDLFALSNHQISEDESKGET